MLRTFEKSDWYGFAGAEPFADGKEPLIDDSKPDRVVIIDRSGIGIYFENEAAFMHDSLGSREADVAFSDWLLKQRMTIAFLKQHGFVRVN